MGNLVRANALEDNVVLYKVEGGKRTPLEPIVTAKGSYGVKLQIPKQTWSALKRKLQNCRQNRTLDQSRQRDLLRSFRSEKISLRQSVCFSRTRNQPHRNLPQYPSHNISDRNCNYGCRPRRVTTPFRKDC